MFLHPSDRVVAPFAALRPNCASLFKGRGAVGIGCVRA